ncbi:MAG: hypothetical protein EOM21_07700 [Gammaproteobacteria bacterium]|nr:hypothetical protein [Gammaproteobacteria bacterium]
MPETTNQPRIARYLRVVNWARRRYTHDGRLTTFRAGQPAIFTRIESAAWAKYMAVQEVAA